MSQPLKKSAGIALVTVLLVVAIATIAAVSISARLQVDARRTENFLRSDQAWLHMLGVEAWAKAELIEDAKNSNQVDSLDERWNIPMTDSAVEGGETKGHMVDQQGLFNLNSLIDQQPPQVNPLNEARFIRLLDNRDLNPDLADAVIDWLDNNPTQHGVGGAEDDTYQALNPPYSAANRYMAHRSELLLVNGFTLADYKKLAPFVTALPVAPIVQGVPPVPVEININTAPREVLESVLIAMAGQSTSGEINTVVAERESDPFKNQADINNRLPAAAAVISRNDLGVESHYFMVHSQVTVGQAKVGVASLLYRKQTGEVIVVQRMREDIF